MIKSGKNLVASQNAVDCVVSMMFKGDYAGHFVHTFRYLGTTSKTVRWKNYVTSERFYITMLPANPVPGAHQGQYWLKINVKLSKK